MVLKFLILLLVWVEAFIYANNNLKHGRLPFINLEVQKSLLYAKLEFLILNLVNEAGLWIMNLSTYKISLRNMLGIRIGLDPILALWKFVFLILPE
jgi:hypothetical protein